MPQIYHLVVLGSLVPDPLQTLAPAAGPATPGLKNELMLPAILDPWASQGLYQASRLAKEFPGSKVWLASLGPKAKLQQLMMSVAQKAPFELAALDGPAGGFLDAAETAAALAGLVSRLPGLDRSRLLLFGGWESACRGTGAVLAMVAEELGLTDLFLAVDELTVQPDGTLTVLERVDGGQYQRSHLPGPPAAIGWATGHLPDPPNNPQTGMANMRLIMPALQKASPTRLPGEGLVYSRIATPSQRRETRVVKNASVEEIAQELAAWIRTHN